MNILVIGNGFDLAHELPTKYTDFLEFCKRVFPIYERVKGRGIDLYQQEFLFDWDFDKAIKEALKNAYISRKRIIIARNRSQIQTDDPRLDEMYSIIKDNFWIEYFFRCNMYQKENWIDFECEISNLIKSLDKDMRSHDETLDDIATRFSNNFLNTKFCSYSDETKPVMYTYRMVRDALENDLKKLTRALEIYLAEYVNKMKCSKESPDIIEVFGEKDEEGKIKSVISTKVLNFNYTNTFRKVYKRDFDIDFIHGQIEISNTIESNNMVLGIDEYLGKKRRNKEVEFITFKKYYQRIHKQTGCKYKEWVEQIRKSKGLFKNSNGEWHNLYIFGHSLDITDKDILRDLILNQNVYTTVFYLNKDVMGQQIANLVKVIGQDELIKRTGGGTKTIEFKLQQDMVEIEDDTNRFS